MQWLNTLGHDIRNGWRLARKSPVLSVATVLTLALGIGLDTGVFTLFDGLMFRARVNDDPDTFAQIGVEYSSPSVPKTAGLPFASLQDYRAYRAGARSFRDIAAWTPAPASLGGPGGPGGDVAEASTRIVPMLVTCNFFNVYDRTPPLIGRVFDARDCEAPGREPVAVITEDVWRTRYAADAKLIGSTILVNRERFTVVGVMPSGYSGQLRGGLWVPYTMAAAFFGGRDLFREPAAPWLVMVGRLAPNASRANALAELRVIANQQDRLVLERQTTVRLTNGSFIEEPYVRPIAAWWIIPLVMGALSLVFLIACANVAILLLSRASARQHEMAIRISLGASRATLLRMVLVESVMLSVIAIPLSAYLAYLVPVIFKRMTPTLPFYPFHLDLVVFAYLAGLTWIAGILAGIAPALESLKPDVSASLHGQETLFGSTGRWRSRDLLVAAQTGMSLVLLTGAGLFVRAEYRIVNAEPAYAEDRILALAPRISVPPYTDRLAASFYQTLLARVRVLSGVQSAAFASAPPVAYLESEAATVAMALPGEPIERGHSTPFNIVSPSYFDTVGIPIVRGRGFEESDGASRLAPAIVSESLARAMWPDGNGVGATARAGDRDIEVVGIARDVPTLLDRGSGAPMLYRLRPPQSRGDTLLVRFDGDTRSTAGAVRGIVAALDSNAVSEPMTLAALRDDLASRFMRLVRLVIFLGAVGLLLAVIGIYGVVAFAASRRTRELGIRMALGATELDIIRLILATGVKPITAGLGAGLVVALMAAQALAQLFRSAPIPLDAYDPVAYGGVALLLVATAVTAMLGPARRAASADPVHALRQD